MQVINYMEFSILTGNGYGQITVLLPFSSILYWEYNEVVCLNGMSFKPLQNIDLHRSQYKDWLREQVDKLSK